MNTAQISEDQVRRLVSDVLGAPPLAVTHQTFGHNSVTFDVALPERHVIVRANADPQVFATTEHNIAVLSGLGLPVPRLLMSDLTRTRVPFAYMILNKIPGRDLRYELGTMRYEQMSGLAEQLVAFQQRVGRLPQGRGYGYVGIGETGPHASWWELLQSDRWGTEGTDSDDSMGRWQSRIQAAILDALRQCEPYLRSVPPTCFLDDITVKNVIVQNGTLQGLVDFDCICYGDPLYWLALTATGVVSDVGTRELFYVEELKRLWNLTPMQEQVLALYSARMALDFLRRFAHTETPEWQARMAAAVEGCLRQFAIQIGRGFVTGGLSHGEAFSPDRKERRVCR